MTPRADRAKKLPPGGVRTCRVNGERRGNGGKRVDCEELKAEGGLEGRLQEFLRLCTPVARAVVIAQVADLIDRAEAGELTMRVRAADPGDVCVMGVAPEVMEMVLPKQIGHDRKPRWLRIYFTEPLTEPGVILLLAVTWKGPYPEGKAEQDAAALEAMRRFRSRYEPNG